MVADGMFDSLKSLKAPDMNEYKNLPSYSEAVSAYNHIIKLASSGARLPTITLAKGEEMLRKLRSTVMDFFSLTSLHFLHLGEEGVQHFVFLLNAIISHINCSSAVELNTVWANILYKQGGKDRELDRSYRTISCCPLIAKAMDSYYSTFIYSSILILPNSTILFHIPQYSSCFIHSSILQKKV